MSSLFDSCDLGDTPYKRVTHDNYQEYCKWRGEIAAVCGGIDNVEYDWHDVILPYKVIVHTDKWMISHGNNVRKILKRPRGISCAIARTRDR